MELIKLLGILIVIIGFALKKDSILIIILAAIVTTLVGGLGITGFLNTLGTSFVANRAMAVFIIIMLVTGTLERNGLKEVAGNLISKIKGASSGVVIGVYGLMRSVFAAFNISFGGVAGFVRPIIMPMAVGTLEAKHQTVNEDYVEDLKGMSSGMENIVWFFCQVLFVGGPGALLVQATLSGLGYEVNLIDLAAVEIPVAIFAVLFTVGYYFIKDRRLEKKYYGNDVKNEGGHN